MQPRVRPEVHSPSSSQMSFRENVDEFEKEKTILREKGLVTNNSSNEHSKIIYTLPVPKEKITKTDVTHSPAHQGNLSNSIDFIVPEGTEIYAAADGVVIEIKDDSNVGGEGVEFWNEGNYIKIEHDGETTLYEHLKFKGVAVKLNERVGQHQLIGYSGNTGYSDMPHLHFEVQKRFGSGDNDYVTLKARFKDGEDFYKN